MVQKVENMESEIYALRHNEACNDIMTSEHKKTLNIVRMSGATLKKDGDQWHWMLGENIQEGVNGFGDTPMEAARAFEKEFGW